jgi:hypothetical protein
MLETPGQQSSDQIFIFFLDRSLSMEGTKIEAAK